MEGKTQEFTVSENRVNSRIRDAALGRNALSSEIEVPTLMMSPEKLDRIHELRYSTEIITAMEQGDILEESDPRKVLLQRMNEADAPKQRKSNIEQAVFRLSEVDYGGLLIIRKILQKMPSGKEVEVPTRLSKTGSFIVVDQANFGEYKRLAAAA